MVAKSSPSIFHTHLKDIIDIWFGRWDKEENMLPRTARKRYSKGQVIHLPILLWFYIMWEMVLL